MITNEALKKIADLPERHPRVTIAYPMHEGGPGRREDSIRFKNLADTVVEQLDAQTTDAATVQAITDRLTQIADDPTQTQHHGRGIVIHIEPDEHSIHQLDAVPNQLVITADRFVVRPLVPSATGSDSFRLLTLSQNAVALYDCTSQTVEPVDIPGVPTSIDEAIGAEREEKSLQFHTGDSAGGGNRPAVFHGQGRSSNEPEGEIETFIARVANALDRHFAMSDPRPLVLAGVDDLVARFRNHTNHTNICDHHIAGNYDHAKLESLHTDAADAANRHRNASRANAIDDINTARGHEQAAFNLEDIIPAAIDARIATLAIRADEPRWGVFDRSTNTVHHHAEQTATSDDLADLAIHHAIRTGATVVDLKEDELPDASVAAASLRF